jgi:archaellum component FlaC
MLSMDVESNPGPLSKSDRDDILKAIKDSSDSLKEDIKKVTLDVNSMKNDIKSIHTICNDMKSDIATIQSKQEKFDENLTKIDCDLENLKVEKEMLHLDVDKINENCERNSDRLSSVESVLQKMERNAIKQNLRIFGYIETQTSDQKSELVNKILRVARPDIDWSTDSITDTYRIGKPGNYVKTLVISFKSSDQKYAMFTGRDALRSKGIRISNDLTNTEKEKLSELKSRGETGYFLKGKLHVRPKTVLNNRTYLHARRRTNAGWEENSMDTQTTQNHD